MAPTPLSAAQRYTLPTRLRPRQSPASLVVGCIWAVYFNLAIISIHLLQLLCLPLAYISEPLYQSIVKAPFGKLTVTMTQIFAPTELVLSAGQGMPSSERDWVQRDKNGRVTGIKLPDKAVWVANHQTLCDWLYIWSLAYLSSHHSSIYIILKASLRRIPIIGWGCQLYGFLFLSRKWATDKTPFLRDLSRVARDAEKADKMALLIFPEGTIVTVNQRPRSRAFARKTSIPDTSYVLLPRSTGLFYALRALRHESGTDSTALSGAEAETALVDLTIGYPGSVHYPPPSLDGDGFPASWPEEHYPLTLWFTQSPPPALHVHIRTFLLKDIPLGSHDGSRGAGQGDGEGEGSLDEKKKFDEWLVERWREKDALMETFARTGSFTGASATIPPTTTTMQKVERQGHDDALPAASAHDIAWPIALRHTYEHSEIFSVLLLAVFAWVAWRYHFQYHLTPFSSSTSSSSSSALATAASAVSALSVETVKSCCRQGAAAAAATVTAATAARGGEL